jgi:hypothetical protein
MPCFVTDLRFCCGEGSGSRRTAQQFADKGRDTLLDGYNEDEFERVYSELWERGATSPECYFRTLVDILLGHPRRPSAWS